MSDIKISEFARGAILSAATEFDMMRKEIRCKAIKNAVIKSWPRGNSKLELFSHKFVHFFADEAANIADSFLDDKTTAAAIRDKNFREDVYQSVVELAVEIMEWLKVECEAAINTKEHDCRDIDEDVAQLIEEHVAPGADKKAQTYVTDDKMDMVYKAMRHDLQDILKAALGRKMDEAVSKCVVMANSMAWLSQSYATYRCSCVSLGGNVGCHRKDALEAVCVSMQALMAVRIINYITPAHESWTMLDGECPVCEKRCIVVDLINKFIVSQDKNVGHKRRVARK